MNIVGFTSKSEEISSEAQKGYKNMFLLVERCQFPRHICLFELELSPSIVFVYISLCHFVL
jgi:hypothetical protein